MSNIDEYRIDLAKKYFAEYKKTGKNILKALNLCLPEINNLIDNGVKNREQIAILESMFDTNINYETYRQFVYKKTKSSKKVAQKSELKKDAKKTHSTDTKIWPKKDEKVAPRESKKDRVTLDNFNDFKPESNSKYDKYLNKDKK